jgi:hypothetical protein
VEARSQAREERKRGVGEKKWRGATRETIQTSTDASDPLEQISVFRLSKIWTEKRRSDGLIKVKLQLPETVTFRREEVVNRKSIA